MYIINNSFFKMKQIQELLQNTVKMEQFALLSKYNFCPYNKEKK